MRYSDKKSKKAGRAFARRGWRIAALIFAVGVLMLCWRYGMQMLYREEVVKNVTAGYVEENTSYLAVTDVDAEQTDQADETVDLSELTQPLTITDARSYSLHGHTDQPVYVNAPEQTVRIVLDNAEILSAEGPAILIENADRVIITLAPDSSNTVADAPNRMDGDDTDGCVYSACPLVFNGTGSLEVTGLYRDAIRSRDSVKIIDGSYRLSAKRTGIRGNDGVCIAGGSVFVGAEKNGVQTTKHGSDGRGALILSGGEISVVAGRYAFAVEKAELYIVDCRVFTNSVISDFDVHGTRYIGEGCLQ